MDTKMIIENLQQIKTLVEECLSELSGVTAKKRKDVISESKKVSPVKIDFTIPIRPFIKRHAKGMSGSKKFALLLAYITKGEISSSVKLDEIKRQWNCMTTKSLMGLKFNRFHSAKAKENDWVESKKNGYYNLRPSWRDIF